MSFGRIRLKINERLVEAEPGITVLECARKNGLYIPSLCELEGLAAFASCRLCLIEIKGRPFWSPACQTLVEEGMEVITSSEELESLRRSIFELILSEHPYFCLLCSEKPICNELKVTMAKALEPGGCIFCPKDGNCELQQVAEYLKIEKVSYEFEDKGWPLWQKDPFISYNPNLCILCGRCVRVCGEIRGEGVLSFVNRGTKTVIGTFYDRTLVKADCSFCGACVDVCPTAAFTEKGLVAAKGKNLSRQKFICPLCSCGCELEAEIMENGAIRRILPAADKRPAFMSGCARGRFGLRELLTEFKRIFKPKIRSNGFLVETSWDEALESVVKNLEAFSPEEIAFVFNEQTYIENLLAFLEVGQKLGVKNFFWFYPETFLKRIDEFEKENQVKFNHWINPDRLSEFRSYLVLDSDLKSEAPTFWLELNKWLRNGAKLVLLDSGLNKIERSAAVWLKSEPGREYLTLLALLKLLLEKIIGFSFYSGFEQIVEKLNQVSGEILAEVSGVKQADVEKAVGLLVDNQPSAIIFGQRFLRQETWRRNLWAVWNLALKLEAEVFPITSRINEIFVSRLASQYPLQVLSDLTAFEQRIRDKKIRAVFILGDLPLAVKPEFLGVLNVFETPLAAQSDVFLPIASSLESSGSLVDFNGKIKKSLPQIKFSENSLSGLQIFLRLGSRLGIKLTLPEVDFLQTKLSPGKTNSRKDHWRYLDIEDDLRQVVSSAQAREKLQGEEFMIVFDQDLGSYSGLILSEVVPGFKRIQNPDWVWLNPADAERHGFKNGSRVQIETESGRLAAEVRIDYGIKLGTAVIKPVLTNPMWLNFYLKGILRGSLRAENE